MAPAVVTPGTASDGTLARYLTAVLVTIVAILSQYFVPQNVPALRPVYASLPGDLFVVYGIPVIAFALLVGPGPLGYWRRRTRDAVEDGLAFYAGATIATLALLVVMVLLYEALDPSALQLLSRQNPALTQATGDPWFWVGFSFVIGAFEEAIFRGWIFGFWRGRAASWVGPAVGSSAVFAALHLYYGTTYGLAAPLIFPGLFFLGLAFAATYQSSGGNLLVVALLHGLFDASAFLTLVNSDAGLLLRYLPVLVGLAILLERFFQRDRGDRLPWYLRAGGRPSIPAPGPPAPSPVPSPPSSGPPGTVL